MWTDPLYDRNAYDISVQGRPQWITVLPVQGYQWLHITPSKSSNLIPPSTKISATFFSTSNLLKVPFSINASSPRAGGKFFQSFRQPRSYNNFRPEGCSMRNDQVPHLTLSKPLIGGSHMLSQEIPTSCKLVSMALILTVVFDGGALRDGAGLAAIVVEYNARSTVQCRPVTVMFYAICCQRVILVGSRC